MNAGSKFENETARRLYSQEHFRILETSSRQAITRELVLLAETGTIGPILAPFTRRAADKELQDSNLDPKGPAAKILHPRELARLLHTLEDRGKMMFLWIGNTANRTLAGDFNPETEHAIGDFDLTFVSKTDTVIGSEQDLFTRLQGAGANLIKGSHNTTSKYPTVIGRLEFPEDANNPVGLVVLTMKRYGQSGIANARLCLKKDNHAPDWMNVDERSIADIGFSPSSLDFDSVRQAGLSLPREDSLMMLLVPKPDKKSIPFDVWLIDPQRATDPSFDTDILMYPPSSGILNPDKSYRGVLRAHQGVIRAERLSFRRQRQVPQQFFLDSAREIRKAARKFQPRSHDERTRTSIKLEATNLKLAAMIEEFPTLSILFLCSEICSLVCPRVGMALSFPARNSKFSSHRAEILEHGFNQSGSRLSLTDVIHDVTAIAADNGIQIYPDEMRARSLYKSPFARNAISPFPSKKNINAEPHGAGTAPVHTRIVDYNVFKALEIYKRDF